MTTASELTVLRLAKAIVSGLDANGLYVKEEVARLVDLVADLEGCRTFDICPLDDDEEDPEALEDTDYLCTFMGCLEEALEEYSEEICCH